MRAEVKQQWLNALQDDVWVRGKGTLGYRDSEGVDKRCVLGVLCEVARADGLKMTTYQTPHVFGQVLVFDGEDTTIPMSVEEWAELDDDDDLQALVRVNDSEADNAEVRRFVEERL